MSKTKKRNTVKSKAKSLRERYDQLNSEAQKYKPLWDSISKYVGITVNTEYSNRADTKGQKLDDMVNDPTAALAVMQAGDYMHGIMWGTGENAITLEPSEALLEKVGEKEVKDWFGYSTNRTLFHMNHTESGLNNALKPYNYDQFASGTSGIGAFLNKQFLENKAENALIHRSYGVDNLLIDEGSNGVINVVFIPHQWRVNRIIEEFAVNAKGEFDEELFAKLPTEIQADWTGQQYNNLHKLVHAIYPREDYDPKLRGKKGARYRGSWYLHNDSTQIFFEEDYVVFPIPVARAIKVRGEVYGRAPGTLILSTIMSVDYMVGETIQILEKMQDPALGIWNSASFGDTVLDSSAGGLTSFNQELMGAAKDPVFKIGDTGDPTGIIQFLIPYMNEKIATAFKIDILLDFNSKGDRTATEMIQRAIIRGKNLSGMLMQQKIELYDRLIDRDISLLWQANVFGVDENMYPEQAEMLKRADKSERIIPEAVIECQNKGIKWYKIRYNGELDRLTQTEAMEKVLQLLNIITAMMTVFPAIVEAVEWYKLWKDVNKYLGLSYFKSEKDFQAAIEKQAQMQQMAMAAELQKTGAGIEKDLGSAEKSNREAKQI